ncbi:MAG: branched-chain amino acid ABC transporter permease [Rhodospirillaceae bacterium]|jgi:branched-chain amino acid transport system permease protein|nr:branched-chain amino acid ABC transporter permease [Rhodospirillaceae bacterium]
MNSVLLINGLIGGVVFGAIYALIGSSLNVLVGVLRIINFAHGEFILAGGFLTYVLLTYFGINPLVALPFAAVLFFAVGYVLYYLLIPRLAHSDEPETASFLLMFGVSLMIVSVLTWIFEADVRPINFSFDPINVLLYTVENGYGEGRDAKVLVPTARLVALAINALIIVALTWFFYRTLPGKAMRAAIMNREAVQIVGIDIHRLSATAFGLAASLAAVTGVLLTLVVPSIDPNGGADLTLIGFIVIALGGLGHPVGALAAGIIFGLVEQVSNVMLPQAAAQMLGFMILVAVIFFKPSGLFGLERGR